MLRNYFKLAIRNLWKNKIFSLINLVGLALGIACSLGIFIIVRHESNFDTFHADHKNIYRIVCDFRYPEGTEHQSGVPMPLPESFKLDFPQVKKMAPIMGGYNNQIDIIDNENQKNEKRFKIETGTFYTSPDFFEIFNFKWLAGSAESVLSKPNQAALTKDLAEKYFGTWQNAIGKTIKKDNSELLQISGVIENPPVNTDFPFQLVISYMTYLKSDNAKRMISEWGSVSSRFQFYIKLPDENEKARVVSGLNAFRKKHLSASNTTDFYVLQPLRDIHFNDQYGNFSLHTVSPKTLLSLSLIGLFLLALACINFINLATAQAVKRSREVGIRKVLGSRRLQLGFQFLGETFVIVIAATIVAIVLLAVISPLTEKILSKPIPMNPFQSADTLFFAVAIIFVVTFLSGFYPAIIVSGFKPIQALKNKITANSSSGISLRRILVVLQFVIAQGLIIATLVIITQIKFFQSSPLGFNKDAIITVSLPRDSVSKTKWETFRNELLQKSDIENVSFSYTAPAAQNTSTTNIRFNQNLKAENFEVNMKYADAEYLKTYHLQLLAGHFYEASDTAREIVVNETLLKKERILDYKTALGKFIMLDKEGSPLIIVGVVKDFHQGSLRDPIEPIIILPEKNAYRTAGIKISTKNISTAVQNIQDLFSKEFPAYLFERNFLDESIEKFYAQEQQLSLLLKLFAAVGIFISCIGLYGLILFMTIQRIKEVGVRKILGASVSSIVMLFFKEFIWLITIAFVIAASVTWYLMNNWLNDFAFHTKISWWMILSVGLGSLLLAMITVSTQTIKAAVANPVKSLRTE